MLKKLLASALAVATVASCAYVPTALASAATTTDTVTATAGEYQAYKLAHPVTPTQKKAVTLYVINGSNSNKDESITVDADKLNVEGVTAAIVAKGAEEGYYKGLDGKDYPSGSVMKQKTLNSVTEISTGVYIVSVTEKTRYEITTVAIKTASISYQADEADYGTDVATLGYYETDAEALAAATANTAYKDAVKYANAKFNQWKVADGLVSPDVSYISGATDGYTAITCYNLSSIFDNANNNDVGAQLNATILYNGTYYAVTLNEVDAKRPMDGAGTMYVPTSEKADWATYVKNYISYNGRYGWNDKLVNHKGEAGKNDDCTTYEPTGVAIVDDNGTSYAVVTYSLKADPAKVEIANVSYTIKIEGTVGTAVPKTTITGGAVATSCITDPEAIYALVKDQEGNKFSAATLAEYVAGTDTDNKYYVTAVPSKTIVTETNQASAATPYTAEVEVTVEVKKGVKTAAYYYDENGTIATKDVYLTATQKADMTKVTAADLDGIADTTVNGYKATFKSAAINKGNEVEVTYTLTKVDLSSFETTTGKFDDVAYFGKKGATVGSKVMLKVSLSDTAIAAGLDIDKVTVKYQVVSGTAGDNYKWTPAEGQTYKEGIATDITLAEGANVVYATVYYDKEEVGTFDAFYAIVK
jgi:hypothetical protein